MRGPRRAYPKIRDGSYCRTDIAVGQADGTRKTLSCNTLPGNTHAGILSKFLVAANEQGRGFALVPGKSFGNAEPRLERK